MKKYLIVMLVGTIIFSITIAILSKIGRYDDVCFFTTLVVTTIETLINRYIIEDLFKSEER